ncbi:MAG: AbrB/MazE/SpoVT family DNA-binding domain-containing protein [Dehalococcoidia bacterium]|nr:AbrB/MazE/SpoVT family DNA-binding domain-containing protein [Dehalococcoidia bacterium]
MQVYTARITTKGQVTIPAEIRHLLGLAPHDRVAFLVEAGQVKIAPATSVVARTAGMLKGDEPMLSTQREKSEAEEAMAQEVDLPGHKAGKVPGRHLRKTP